MSYQLLSEPIRKYVRDQRWEELRPIQNAAIDRIMTTDDHYILASRTASGKTEAAFLPILSKINFASKGVSVLYISPLIALINDQFIRVEELCEYLDFPVTKWHGEANRAAKDRLLENPGGVVLITPESLEAMFVNKPFNITHLFDHLQFLVIDEIHSFIGTARGVQLQSIISRLQQVNTSRIRIIGLSATIGDYQAAKAFTGDPEHTKVLLDKTKKDVNATIKYFPTSNGTELPLPLLEDLYEHTKDHKVLVFPNSRGRAEEIAVNLKKISDLKKGHPYYFSHHSSVDREVREYVEDFAKNNKRYNFCIACTSTLELGIDIGTVDEVVQIDATHSIASLIQRLGRSGRRGGEPSRLQIYATKPWSLLQSLACWVLYQEGFIEPPVMQPEPFDIMVHQLLSIVKGHSGIKLNVLVGNLRNNFAFAQISVQDIESVVKHLLKTGMLENIGGELIIGVDGERIVNSRDFYSVFKTEENFKVVNAGTTIGNIPFSPMVIPDQNILLAARIWKIQYVDMRSKRIEVVKALDGKKPIFFGSGGSCHPKIREKMLEILISSETYDLLDDAAAEQLKEMRSKFNCFKITDFITQRPLLRNDKDVSLFTFSGSIINRTLNFLMLAEGIPTHLDPDSTEMEIELGLTDFRSEWSELLNAFSTIDNKLAELIESTPAVLDFSKWMIYLPRPMQVKLLSTQWFDIAATQLFVQQVSFVMNEE